MNNKLISYRIVFIDGRGAAEALAHTVGGSWRDEVSGFDFNGTYDMAFVDIPVDQVEYFEEMLDSDENVVNYGD